MIRAATVELEPHLEKLLVSWRFAACRARQIRQVRHLPPRLQTSIIGSARGTAWCAYSCDHEIICVLGRLCQPVSDADDFMLEAYILDGDAVLLSRGFWKFDPALGSEPQQVGAKDLIPCALRA